MHGPGRKMGRPAKTQLEKWQDRQKSKKTYSQIGDPMFPDSRYLEKPKVPKELDGDDSAVDFYDSFAEIYISSGYLTPETMPTFIILCSAWSSWLKSVELVGDDKNDADMIKALKNKREAENHFFKLAYEWGMTLKGQSTLMPDRVGLVKPESGLPVRKREYKS